jgi:malate/lactate dehydrogenase
MGGRVAIIGAAGTLGSCTASALATRGIPSELVLFDVNERLLRSHFMDPQTATAVLNDTQLRIGEDADLAGCDVVVVTAGAPWRQISSRMELLRDSLPILRGIAEKIARYCPDAVVITATNPVDPLNYAFQVLSGMPRSRLVGYTLNDSYRFRMLVAQALGTTASHVEGYVLGEHGEHQALLFSTLKVGGNPLVADEAFKARIAAEIPKILHAYESLGTGRTSGWTSAVGLAHMVQAIVQDTHELFPCSVILEGEYGRRGFSAGVPARLGEAGVVDVREWALPSDEGAQLERAFDYLEAKARALEASLRA